MDIQTGAAVVTVALAFWTIYQHITNKVEALEKKMDAKFDAYINAIHLETKDFHGRLCKIEERMQIKAENVEGK